MIKEKIYIIAEALFSISLLLYLVLLTIDVLKAGFVSQVFNTKIILIITTFSGIITYSTKNYTQLTSLSPAVETKKTANWKYNVVVYVASGIIVYIAISEIGLLSKLIAIIAIIIAYIISNLLD